ncbi:MULTISPECIES: HNH endonuclease family protein [unclassified Anabaena]|uniref:HNH endonuclease family protein n=1 Tax=unclassified Anabaena TaxID=2619674 RepID=UPI0039C62C02
MAKNSPKVSLDALISREAFEVQGQSGQNIGRNIPMISVRDLEKNSFFYPFLRKPDFQRETNEWEAEKICEFIESFLDGDLIPSVILWRSTSSYYFVIDGSHRLSSLIAWINDDYGDGKISKEFYDGDITEEQKNAAQEVRKQIKQNIGTYKDYQSLTQHRGQVDPKLLERARNLGALGIQLQWVEGDSEKAETSFFKINQKAAPIGETEMRLLLARKMPNGVAARAIMRSGNGHKYWSEFSQQKQDEIEKLAQEIHQLIFEPKLKNPIKTLDVPIVGNLSSSEKLEVILEFVNMINGIEVDSQLGEDGTGEKTVELLINCKKVAQRINSNHPSSLGLHPIIYFYTSAGKPKIGSFYGIATLILHLETTRYFTKFIQVRKDFEWVIWQDDMVPQIVSKNGSAVKARLKVKEFYIQIIEKLLQGTDKKNVIKEIIAEKVFGALKPKAKSYASASQTKEFSRETKSAAFIRDALPGSLRCKICGSYLPVRISSIDHIKRKADGGLGNLDNAQLTHPYCNTTIKN